MNPLPLLDWEPPSQRHSPTSKEAAISIKESASTLRAKVYNFLLVQAFQSGGATDEEIQFYLGMSGNTERPRRRELQQAGKIKDSGLTRTTTSGRNAVVWVVT